jgi:hypothetical protein
MPRRGESPRGSDRQSRAIASGVRARAVHTSAAMPNFKSIIITAAICLPLGFAVAGPLKGHPNMQAAAKALDNAAEKITAAQKANEWDMDGHAQKAKEAIDTAVSELKKAAEVANSKEAPKK